MDNVDESVKTPDLDPEDSDVILTALKEEANRIGLKFNDRIGIAKLRAKIDRFLEVASDTPQFIQEIKTLQEETAGQRRARLKKEASKLIRLRIHCVNPNKRNWLGEIISVGSSSIGTFKKFIPFGLEAGYHVPNIIYEFLKEREFQSFYTIKGKNGRPDEKRSKLLKEFNIEVLPPLTPKELEELAHEQAVNHSIEQE